MKPSHKQKKQPTTAKGKALTSGQDALKKFRDKHNNGKPIKTCKPVLWIPNKNVNPKLN